MIDQIVSTRQLGNYLEVVIRIPWSQVNGQNQWHEYFEQHPTPVTPDYWAATTARVLTLYKKHKNISATAKAAGKHYYIVEKIVKAEQVRLNKVKRASDIEQAHIMRSNNMSINDIAKHFGKCPNCIRSWLKK